ncbi:Succinate dehydrogenase subunit 7B-mitochondrial [Striga hermonthica]|uniref:Succinate dehydrogenase subunit 7B-mitochondrial n=1 Tax=Striga hermonthica TaxID=68872 RepID=A0A9N7NSH3_STRHE|nr:Succinate dehydrogenase subunit 7B-mitochondrial [Striga hermonthica]
MAFFLNKSTRSALRLSSQKADDSLMISRRGLHVEPGAREKALLEEHPSLKRFKSTKNTVRLIKRAGDVLTVIVVAGCCYEIYVRAVLREEARKQAKDSA